MEENIRGKECNKKEIKTIMSHKHKRDRCFCDRKFHDTVGKGKLDSTPITVPPDFNTEVGSENHPGPFAAQAFHPSGQRFFGLMPRRNTPNRSKERGGKVLIDDKKHDEDRFYKPRIKRIHRNFANKKH